MVWDHETEGSNPSAWTLGIEMPAYDYKCEKCERITEQFKSISNRHNPDPCECGSEKLNIVFQTPTAIGDPVLLGIKKNDSGWKEVLQKIKEKHPGANGIKIR